MIPALEWSLATPYGIQMDDAAQVWHAGHVNDIVEVDQESIVVATDKGGVWHLTTQGDGVPLSDAWNNPDTLSLALGFSGSRRHIFAASGEFMGRGALWVTDPNTPDPFSAWHNIPVPNEARGIIRVVVSPGVSRIVLAAQRGLWFSALPAPATPFTYQWNQVAGLPNLRGDIWAEVAESSGPGIVAALSGNGLFFGGWVAGVLQMQPAVLPPGVDVARLGRTSLASCAADRRFVYAASADAAGSIPNFV
jgi:hypothetical protein